MGQAGAVKSAVVERVALAAHRAACGRPLHRSAQLGAGPAA